LSINGIQLRQEVFASDAWKIAEWLEDHEITKFLNEEQDISKVIKQTIYRVNMPILTHLFNRNSSFFMVTHKGQPIGFLKLIPKGEATELVVVIGEKEIWGNGFGRSAINQGLKHAFFTMRNNKVIAKIKKDNERSRRVFRRVGFAVERVLTREVQYNISREKFLRLA
jgi:RimJ/RimL family protein N-acetyltransferase